MAYTPVLEAGSARIEGSSPSFNTMITNEVRKTIGKKKPLTNKPLDMKNIKIVYCEHVTVVRKPE